MDKNAEYLGIGIPDSGAQIRILKESISKDLKCHRIGRITAFDSSTFLCTVQLLDKMTFYGQEENFVEIPSLPLLIQGTDSKHITFGDIVGSECLVHFNDVDMDNWLETGESYSPNSRRKHDFSDGFVELRPFNKTAVFTYYTGGIEIKNGGTTIRVNDDGSITISGGDITVTGNLTVSGTITGQTDVIAGTISGKTHKHTGVQTGSGTSGTPV